MKIDISLSIISKIIVSDFEISTPKHESCYRHGIRRDLNLPLTITDNIERTDRPLSKRVGLNYLYTSSFAINITCTCGMIPIQSMVAILYIY